MKKIMIALAAVAFAGAAQAEKTLTFSCGNVKDGYKATTIGGTSTEALGAGYAAYFVNWDEDGFFSEQYSKAGNASYYITQSDFLTNLRKERDVAKAAGNALLASSTTLEGGSVDPVSISLSENSFYTSVNGSDDDRIAAFLAIVVGDDVFISTVSVGNRTDSELGLSAWGSRYRNDVDGTAAFSSDGWYSLGSVPEPTSGLLMLVGMAGLALRRKRA